MTVIAYKGGVISCDSLAVCGGNKTSCKKWEVVGDAVLIGSGDLSAFLQFVAWYKDGANPEKWPSNINKNDFTCVIVCVDGKVWEYEYLPYPIEVIDNYAAWGSGREYALGAIYMGASTAEACEAAALHSNGCGGQIHTFKVA